MMVVRECDAFLGTVAKQLECQYVKAWSVCLSIEYSMSSKSLSSLSNTQWKIPSL